MWNSIVSVPDRCLFICLSDSRDCHGLSFLDMMFCTLVVGTVSLFFFDSSGDFVFGVEHGLPAMITCRYILIRV